MIANFQRILFTIAAALIAVDLVWGFYGHFQVDVSSYARLGLLSLGMAAGGLYYQVRRGEPALAAIMFGTGFLCAFSAAASVLNYFLLTVAGRRIDDILVAADRALGFDWYNTMVAMSHHVMLNDIFFRIYNTVLPQIALVLIALAWSGRAEKVYRYCLALAIGALIAIAIWSLMPSLGAKSLYILPPDVEARLTLSITTEYGRELVALLHKGPGYITPSDVRGLIAFPSYHGVLALLVTFYAWPVRWLRWPVLLINAVVLISTPIQGGHHLVDVLAAFPVAALSIFIASLGERAQSSAILPAVVNKKPKLSLGPVPQGLFRIDAEQDQQAKPAAIKPKLSGAS
jgi:hypothetical protein